MKGYRERDRERGEVGSRERGEDTRGQIGVYIPWGRGRDYPYHHTYYNGGSR